MQRVFGESDAVRKSKIVFLPFIDLPPNELNCVYSALKFISETATRNGKLPACTFDQVLWWKALLVTVSPNCDLGTIVIQLGGFHTIMSFLGCIGYLMSGTGICEALEVVYAGNTVPHLLSGKAVSRALQGHQLLDLVLNTILLEDLMPELGIDSSILENMMTDAKKWQVRHQ